MRAGAGLRGDAVLLRAFCVPAGMSCVRSRRSCGSIGLFCARSRRSCVPVEMSCVRLMSVVRFYWDVLAFVRACHTFLSGCLMFDHACCLPHSAKQDGLRNVAFLFRRGSGSPVTRSRMSCGYRAWLVYSGIVCFLAAIPTGDGKRSRRRSVSAFLRKHIGFEMLSAGRTLGQKVEAALRPRPRLRQGDSSPWTLII